MQRRSRSSCRSSSSSNSSSNDTYGTTEGTNTSRFLPSRSCTKSSRSSCNYKQSDESAGCTLSSGSHPASSRSNSSSSSSSRSSVILRFFSYYWDVGPSFKWNCRRSRLIGFSCLMYLLPGLCLFCSSANSNSDSNSSMKLRESYLWIFVTMFSFLSDYVFSGQRHIWCVRAVHLADRWLASAAFFLQCIYNLPLWFCISVSTGVLGLVLICMCCYIKYLGGIARRYREYALAHTTWHIAGAIARCIMAFLET